MSVDMIETQIHRRIANQLHTIPTRYYAVLYIKIMENNTIKEFKTNIRKYNMVEFMITREIAQSLSEIKIIKKEINQIIN